MSKTTAPKIIRSWLFVPADSEKKLKKCETIDADAIILDLEDAVLPQNKENARQLVVDFLKNTNTKAQIWVRINPLDSANFKEDLQKIMPHKPAGIVLPKPDGPVDVETLSTELDKYERQNGLKPACTKIMAVATETARAVTSLSLYPRTYLPRLIGLSWGAEDLSQDLGALGNRDEKQNFDFIYQMVRSQMLIAAKASGVQAIETLYANFRDKEGLRTMAANAFRQGFNGMLAIHPAQVEIINNSFLPNEAQLRHARAVVEAFENAGGDGAVSLGGKMLDRPHLLQAQKLILLAQNYGDNS